MTKSDVLIYFDIGAYQANEKRHPLEVVKSLGITYKKAHPNTIADSWEFFDCEYDCELPEYIEAYQKPDPTELAKRKEKYERETVALLKKHSKYKIGDIVTGFMTISGGTYNPMNGSHNSWKETTKHENGIIEMQDYDKGGNGALHLVHFKDEGWSSWFKENEIKKMGHSLSVQTSPIM